MWIFGINIKSSVSSLLPFQNKCTQPEDVKLCTLMLRPATAGPQRKKVVKQTDTRDARLASCLLLPASINGPISLPLCPSDPGEGGRGSPPRSGAGSVPASDGAESGSSPCAPDLLPLGTGHHLPVHLRRTFPGSPFNRDPIGPDAASPNPGGWHEGAWGMEGAQRRQREVGDHQGEGEREAVPAEGEEGDTDARHRPRWAEGSVE